MDDSTALLTLTGVTTGRYVLTTRSGTRHVLDLDARTVTRYGAPGREWTEQTDFGMGLVGADEEPFHYTLLGGAAVGESMRVESRGGYLDADLWRRTSTIVSIEPLTEENDPSRR